MNHNDKKSSKNNQEERDLSLGEINLRALADKRAEQNKDKTTINYSSFLTEQNDSESIKPSLDNSATKEIFNSEAANREIVSSEAASSEVASGETLDTKTSAEEPKLSEVVIGSIFENKDDNKAPYIFENLSDNSDSKLDGKGILESKNTGLINAMKSKMSMDRAKVGEVADPETIENTTKKQKILKKSKFNGIKNSIAGNSSEPVAISKNIVFDKNTHLKFYQTLAFKLILLFSMIGVAIVTAVLTVYFLTKPQPKPRKILIEYQELNTLSDGTLVAIDEFKIIPKYNKEYNGNEKIKITTDVGSGTQVGGVVVSFSKTAVNSGETIIVTPLKNADGVVVGGKVIITASYGETSEVKNSITIIIDSPVNTIAFDSTKKQADIFKIVGMNSEQSAIETDKNKFFLNQTATISADAIKVSPINSAFGNLFKDAKIDFATIADRNSGIVTILEDQKTIKGTKTGTVKLVLKIQKWLGGTEFLSSSAFDLTVEIPPINQIELVQNSTALNNLYFGNTHYISLKDAISKIVPKYNIEEAGSTFVSDYMLGQIGSEFYNLKLGTQGTGISCDYDAAMSEKNNSNTFKIKIPQTVVVGGKDISAISINLHYGLDPVQNINQIIGTLEAYTDVVAKLNNLTEQQVSVIKLDSKLAFTELDVSKFFEIESVDSRYVSELTAADIRFNKLINGSIIDKKFVPTEPANVGGYLLSEISAYVEGSSHSSGTEKPKGTSLNPLKIKTTKIQPTINLSDFGTKFTDNTNGNYLGYTQKFGTGTDTQPGKFVQISEITDNKFSLSPEQEAKVWSTSNGTKITPITNITTEINTAYDTTKMSAKFDYKNGDTERGIEIKKVLNNDVDKVPTGEIILTSKKAGAQSLTITIMKGTEQLHKGDVSIAVKDNIKPKTTSKKYTILDQQAKGFSFTANRADYFDLEFNTKLGMTAEDILTSYGNLTIIGSDQQKSLTAIIDTVGVVKLSCPIGTDETFDFNVTLGTTTVHRILQIKIISSKACFETPTLTVKKFGTPSYGTILNTANTNINKVINLSNGTTTSINDLVKLNTPEFNLYKAKDTGFNKDPAIPVGKQGVDYTAAKDGTYHTDIVFTAINSGVITSGIDSYYVLDIVLPDSIIVSINITVNMYVAPGGGEIGL